MHDGVSPTVRPYWLVSDVASAIASAVESGAELLLPAMEIRGRGTIGLVRLSGGEHDFWQV